MRKTDVTSGRFEDNRFGEVFDGWSRDQRGSDHVHAAHDRLPERFGELDKGVIKAAVRLKEASGAIVEVLTLGSSAALGAVKELSAMGADEATVLDDPYSGAADAAVAVRVLEAAIQQRAPYDLMTCGFASDDGYSYQTGLRLAEHTGLPLISYASEIRHDTGVVIVDRDLEDGLQTVSTPLPAIVSVAEEAFVPRSVTLAGDEGPEEAHYQVKPRKHGTRERGAGNHLWVLLSRRYGDCDQPPAEHAQRSRSN
jgi:electron transfer flavoprotein alpha/beta subunit